MSSFCQILFCTEKRKLLWESRRYIELVEGGRAVINKVFAIAPGWAPLKRQVSASDLVTPNSEA